MVKGFRRITFLALAFCAPLLFSACSLKNWWGEKSTRPEITQSGLSQSDCPRIEKIITGDERESSDAFQCWSDRLDQIWKQVEGRKPGFLSNAEIATLVRKNLIRVQGDPETAIQRIYSWKRLFGFPEDLSREKVSEWISWARAHRTSARSLYRKITGDKEFFSFADLRDAVELMSSALHRMNWAMSSDELSRSLVSALEVRDPEVQDAMTPGSEVAINLLNMLCPTFPSKDSWNSHGIALCLDTIVVKFESGAPWFEFLLNQVHSLSFERIQEIQTSLDRLQIEVNDWFSQPGLSPLYPTRWLDFSRKMRANPPENLLDSLRVIRRFKHRSSEEAIYPEEFIRFFSVARKAQINILNGIGAYLNSTQQKLCAGEQPAYWTGCVLPNYEMAAGLSPAIKTAWRVRNLHHGQASAPLNGHEFSKIQVFHEFADQIIELFHDECPKEPAPGPGWPFKKGCNPDFITTDLGDEKDQLVQLITVGVNTAEIVERFVENIRRKFQHLPLKDNDPFLDRRWDIGGFARLIAMTSDILVKRTPEESNLLAKLVSMLILPSKSSLSLDRLAVTGILTAVDSLPQYRRSYLSIIGKSATSFKPGPYPAGQELLIRRSAAISALPEILKTNFPRSYESCVQFGYGKSCQLAFEKILAQAPKGSEYIDAGDLDILTVLGTAMEGMVDSCDRDANTQLHWNPLSGDEELDCGYIKTREILTRLMDSKIISVSGGDETRAKILLWIIDSNPLTRMSGKVAMARGTTDGLAYDFLLSPFNLDATLGSIYGLVADILAPDEARK